MIHEIPPSTIHNIKHENSTLLSLINLTQERNIFINDT